MGINMSTEKINSHCLVCRNPESLVKYSIIKKMVIRKAYCSANCKAKGEAKKLISMGIGSIGIAIYMISTSTFFSIIFGLLGVLFTIRGISGNKIPIVIKRERNVPSEWERIDRMNQRRPRASSRSRDSNTNNYSNVSQMDHVPKVKVGELGKEVLACCYQSARLNQDNYCVCGRVISKDLKQIFMSG